MQPQNVDTQADWQQSFPYWDDHNARQTKNNKNVVTKLDDMRKDSAACHDKTI